MDDTAREWLLWAMNETVSLPPEYHRFMAAYIALNHIYGYAKGNECNRMAACLSKLCDKGGINPFEVDVSEYLALPILDMRQENNGSQKVNPGDRDSLFRAIYQVRCNLFHGNKSLGSERDTNLVKQGADVIIGILSKALGV